MTPPPPGGGARSIADRLASALLREDLEGREVLKWARFAQQVFAVKLGVVALAVGLAAFVSVRRTGALLAGSLDAQGRAIAEAVSRAAFVPLSLEDRAALRTLLGSYRSEDNVAAVTIFDARGAVVERMRRLAGPGAIEASAPVRAAPETGEPAQPVGRVSVEMSSAAMDAQRRRIVSSTLLLCALLVGAATGIGMLLLRRLIARMRLVVGEARLVEEVQQANAELEAFSYSVSHDLRGPLRSISSFSQILLEGNEKQLDEDGKDSLRRIVAATKRMDALINDLLELSRVSRKPLERRGVDLSALAEEALAGLRLREPGRRVEARVEPGLTATGDPSLLRILIENLLDNAWKYTARAPAARIEVGRAPGPQGRAFFVEDNGVGFDPSQAGRLFTPFVRLHSPAEFEGTGIGLATVQRIVRRHGGGVRAEGRPGEGARITFTLQ